MRSILISCGLYSIKVALPLASDSFRQKLYEAYRCSIDFVVLIILFLGFLRVWVWLASRIRAASWVTAPWLAAARTATAWTRARARSWPRLIIWITDTKTHTWVKWTSQFLIICTFKCWSFRAGNYLIAFFVIRQYNYQKKVNVVFWMAMHAYN